MQLLKKLGFIVQRRKNKRMLSRKKRLEEKRKIKYQMVSINTHDELVYLFEKCDSLLFEIAHTNNLNYIDVNKKMPHTLSYFSDHVHTTPKGSNYMANEYYHFLRPIIDSLLVVN